MGDDGAAPDARLSGEVAPQPTPTGSALALEGRTSATGGGAAGDSASGDSGATTTRGDRESPADAATRITSARVVALEQGDANALTRLAVPGSTAWASLSRDARLIDSGTDFTGARVEVSGTTTISESSVIAVVDITYEVSRHEVASPDGSSQDVAAHVESVRLTMAWAVDGWRVVDAVAAVAA